MRVKPTITKITWPPDVTPTIEIATDIADNFYLGQVHMNGEEAVIQLSNQEALALNAGKYLHYDANGYFLTVRPVEQRSVVQPKISKYAPKRFEVLAGSVFGGMFLGTAIAGASGLVVGLLVGLVAGYLALIISSKQKERKK